MTKLTNFFRGYTAQEILYQWREKHFTEM